MNNQQRRNISIEERALSNMYQIEDMARVCESKGLLSRKKI